MILRLLSSIIGVATLVTFVSVLLSMLNKGLEQTGLSVWILIAVTALSGLAWFIVNDKQARKLAMHAFILPSYGLVGAIAVLALSEVPKSMPLIIDWYVLFLFVISPILATTAILKDRKKAKITKGLQ